MSAFLGVKCMCPSYTLEDWEVTLNWVSECTKPTIYMAPHPPAIDSNMLSTVQLNTLNKLILNLYC